MEQHLIKQLLSLTIWVVVGFAFIPLARRKGRSWLLWYILGLASFYVPFLILLFGPILVTALVVKGGQEGVEKLGLVTLLALPIALIGGVYCARKLRLCLKSQLPIERPTTNGEMANERGLVTYGRALLIILPALACLTLAWLFLLPKISAIWMHADLEHSKTNVVLRGTVAIVGVSGYTVCGVLLALLVLEQWSLRWRRWRAWTVAIVTAILNTVVLIAITMIGISALIAVSAMQENVRKRTQSGDRLPSPDSTPLEAEAETPPTPGEPR